MKILFNDNHVLILMAFKSTLLGTHAAFLQLKKKGGI